MNPFKIFNKSDLNKDISILENIITKKDWGAQQKYVNLAMLTLQHILSISKDEDLNKICSTILIALPHLQAHYSPHDIIQVEKLIQIIARHKTGTATKTDTSNWIYVPSIKLHVSRKVTHKGMSWKDCILEAGRSGCIMLTPHEFFEFIKHLRKTNETELLDSILKPGKWRGEFLDAYFNEGNILTHNRNKSETLASNIIKEDCYVDLDSINEQGLPTRKSATQKYIQNNNIYYYYPRNGRVAYFYCDGDNAWLGCGYRNPDYRDDFLGVRFAKP